MELQLSIDELRENVEELQRQCRLKRLRRILKFILIGFLIGRDSEKRIIELEQRINLPIQRMTSHIEELDTQAVDLHQRIRKFTDTFRYLESLEGKVKSFEESSPNTKSIIRMVKEKLEKHRRILVEDLKSIVEQRLSELEKQVEEVVTKSTYLIYADKQHYVKSIDSVEEDLDYCIKQRILDRDFLTEKKDLTDQYMKRVLEYNKHFIAQRKREYSNLWQVKNLSLDDEQQTAIVTDDKHNLVIAAAGSGKTEVLTTRIAYLITRKPDTVRPQRIHAIAYQRKAMEQIKQRLSKRHGTYNVNVSTFHKLGKDILEETGEYFTTADIVNDNKKHRIINRIFMNKIKNEPKFYKQFLDFIRTLHDKEEVRVEEKNQHLEYVRKRPYFSIDNTRVNSRAEKELMDFFLMHKLNGRTIAVRYEFDIGGFRPDFYLPEYDLFIEHWGLTRELEVPEWFSQTTDEYKRRMEMKKQWFAQHKKVLIETFAYEYNEQDPDSFLELIKTRLSSALQAKYNRKFKFTLKSYEEILDVAWQSYRTPEDDISNFITIAKTYGLSPESIQRKLQHDKWSPKQITFGNLTLPIFSAYEEALQNLGKIDFEDMINKAVAKLDSNATLRAGLYDHILIDEYQDISAQRYKLIKKLMDRNPNCKLFSVGDDWQSIMGFSGSNLNFFVNFDQYFENPAITKISTNYRSIKTIVDAGASLIKNNTRCQIQKPTQSQDARTKPIRVLKTSTIGFEHSYDSQAAVDCVERIQHYLHNGCSPKDILVLSRCMRTRTKPHGYKFLSYVKTLLDTAEENDMQLAHDRVYTESKVRLLTAHRSKGLEAKVVFLLNVTEDTYGFPCQIGDSTIFEPARENYPPQDNLEEERRLFYVAITRAMEDLYIYTKESAPSVFLREITDFTTEEPLKTFKQSSETEPITMVESNEQAKEGKSYSVKKIRQKYPKAYKTWSSEEEKALEKQFKAGISIAQIAKLQKRKIGAIRSRLRKIGLLESKKSYIV